MSIAETHAPAAASFPIARGGQPRRRIATPGDPANRLADACAELVRKRHLANVQTLGRQPTAAETTAYAAAVEGVAAQLACASGEAQSASPLHAIRLRAAQLAEEARTLGWTDDESDDWLGAPLDEESGALLDAVHLAPCCDRSDALAKLDAVLGDLETVDALDSVRAALAASAKSIRRWLAGDPPVSRRSKAITRRDYEHACARGVLTTLGSRVAA